MKFMKHKILLILQLIFSYVGFGQSDTITYTNEASKKVKMVIMGDSLWLQNNESKKSVMTYLDYEALEVEGLALYVGKHKAKGNEFDVTVQFLDDSVCTIDSEISEFNFGLSKEEVKQKHKNNPFGSGGDGTNGGFGTGNGKENGINEGSGIGSGKTERKRLNDPNIDQIQTVENVVVHLKLTVNENGEVVSASNVISKTTTSDQRIISQVISAVKQQVKYQKSIGSSLQTVYLTVRLNAK